MVARYLVTYKMQDIIPHNNIPRRGNVRSLPRERTVVRVISVRRPMLYGSVDGIIANLQIEQVIVNESIPEAVLFVQSAVVAGTNPRLRRPLAHAAVKADIVARAVAAQRKTTIPVRTTEPVRKHLKSRRLGLVIAAIFVLALTGYVSIDAWTTNNKVKAEFVQSSGAIVQTAAEQQAQEGHDETPLHKNALADYSVASSLPRALYVNKIKVGARIMPMSVNTDGSVQAPRNIYDSGWYSGSVKPGETGAMFIDGHASGPTREGLFAYLDKLNEGDLIEIEKGDGNRLTYKVVHTEVQPLAGLDMKKMLLPYGTVSKGLNMMTCTGTWVDSSKTFDKRVLVFAEQISS